MSPRLLAPLAFAAVALASCNQTARAPAAPPASSAPPGVTPSSFHLPSGTGCAGDIARFKAVLANDVQVGHLTQSVYARADADADRAQASCAAGNEGQAHAMLSATKSRYGYP